jgi:hypothetical protein
MEKIKSKFEIVINGEHISVSSLQEAEKKLRNIIKSEADAFICRKDYDSKGNLIEEYYVG